MIEKNRKNEELEGNIMNKKKKNKKKIFKNENNKKDEYIRIKKRVGYS